MKTTHLLIFSLILITYTTRTLAQNNVVAHRGAWKAPEIPENSLASLREAIALGCKGSEFDVWMTADGILVIHHDPDIQGISIERNDWKVLEKLKLSDGKRMPTLDEYLKLGKKQTKTRLILELKASQISSERTLDAAQKCFDAVTRLKANSITDYISFDYEACKKIIALDPEAKVSYLNWKHDKNPSQIKADGFHAVDYQFNVFKETPELIEEFRKAGIKLNVWTVNDPEDMKWFIKQNFDYITTDKSAELKKLYLNQ